MHRLLLWKQTSFYSQLMQCPKAGQPGLSTSALQGEGLCTETAECMLLFLNTTVVTISRSPFQKAFEGVRPDMITSGYCALLVPLLRSILLLLCCRRAQLLYCRFEIYFPFE